jgi:hypothetical protein
VFETFREKQELSNNKIAFYYPSYKEPSKVEEVIVSEAIEKSSSGCDVHEMQPHEYDQYLNDLDKDDKEYQ